MKSTPKYWIITDTHFGHKNLISLGHRPEDFEQRILNNISIIREEDTLIHLGDISMKHAKENNSLFINALPAKTKKILCIGNHDNKSTSWYMNNGWDFACRTFTIKLYNRKILFSHIPKHVTHPYVNIHGHTHGNQHRGELLPNGIEIALEKTGYKPLDLEKLLVDNPLKELTDVVPIIPISSNRIWNILLQLLNKTTKPR